MAIPKYHFLVFAEDLVLEDTAENSETVVGEGMAGLLKRIESPTESPGRVLGHTRPEHSKGLPGLITSTLTVRFNLLHLFYLP